MAQKVVARLGSGEVLLRALPAESAATRPRCCRTMSVSWMPTREAGLARLAEFLPRAGRAYREQRNHDRGPGGHDHVSGLSPYIRHRLLAETEVLEAVLEKHSASAAGKFIEEVLWRAYWKGWLEQRPSVWHDYLAGLQTARERLGEEKKLGRRFQSAIRGETGILPFDEWVKELRETGYLHNHARMWFASIWIFTLGLPWALGADFFLRHLLDGDPASNTLSWRWVAGLHTRGKTYLATEANIRKYAGERFAEIFDGSRSSEGGMDRLAARTVALPSEPPPPARLELPDSREPVDGFGLLLTEEDLLLEVPGDPAAVAALDTSAGRADWSSAVTDFKAGALADALRRAGTAFPDAAVRPELLTSADVEQWARDHGVSQLLIAFQPQGYVRQEVEVLGQTLSAAGIGLTHFVRNYDRLVWPHCARGFFQLRKRIPELVRALVDGDDSLARESFTSGS